MTADTKDRAPPTKRPPPFVGRPRAESVSAELTSGGLAYAELQVTTNFTFLAGGSHPHELVAQAKALGLSALAITDRNSLAGVVRAHTAARQLGLKLIVGARLDLDDAPSLLCLPTDRAAYGRLSRLLSTGQLRAGKGSCSLTLADVAAHAQGQIFIVLPPEDWHWQKAATPTSAIAVTGTTTPAVRALDQGARGPAGAFPGESGTAPRPFDSLETSLRRVACALRPSPVHLAATHAYRGDDRARIAALAVMARRCGTPLVATGDIRYHAAHRRPLADVLTCIRDHTTIDRAGTSLDRNAERHLKSPREMARLFKGFEAALARTIEIAQACTFSLDELVYEYPEEPVPAGRTAQDHLTELTLEGARMRFPAGVPDGIAATLRRELALIAELGYAHYFLTVHDIVAYARAQGILCQGRGSAANSVVCYCLGITAVDPTQIDLLFDRFVSPERREPPDIDVDFEHDRREEVIQYIYARYGRHRAGLAATVIRYRARSAVREVGKAMGLSEDTVARLAGMVWGIGSGGALPERHVREAGLDPADPLLARVLELTAELTGFPRHLSQHVGGFVLTRSDLTEVVPIGNAAMADRTVIEWDKDDLDELGLLKVDVLALGMLSCIRRGFELLARTSPDASQGARNRKAHDHGHACGSSMMTLADVPREDPAVYDMLCAADSIGVFQVESRAQMNMLPRLKPRTFYDLVIEVAIVRPGPIQGDMVHPYLRRRDGLEPEIYPSPAPEHGPADELHRILAKTKGVPLFQEQAMRIALVAARFSDAEVNELRKAMATFRRVGTIDQLQEKMVSRMAARGYDLDFAERCFSQIKGFGEYGFPESHAASFAHLVYVSAWLKCHHPAAFAAALLNSQPMGFYAPAQIVRDAREHGVEVRGVDINRSEWDCTLEPPDPPPEGQGTAGPHAHGPALRLGLRQIEGMLVDEAARLVAVRSQLARMPPDRDGTPPGPPTASAIDTPFASTHDLWRRTGLKPSTLERLAAADAFRSIGLDRRQALWEVKGITGRDPLPLFDWAGTRETGREPEVRLPEMALGEHVVDDYQTLRLSLKAHPMSFLRPRLEAGRISPCARLRDLNDGASVLVAGLVLVRQRPGSAKGVVFMTIEDESGIANAVVWPTALERFRREVMTSRLILIRGRIQRHQDIIHVIANRLEDRSAWLAELTDIATVPAGRSAGRDLLLHPPLARADEVRRPEPGSWRPPLPTKATNSDPPPAAGVMARHPRDQRIIPKSRDFH